MKSVRRMGPAGSENWNAMLDGAETILREQGYGALTSRRVAERVGVKQRLVYYYFRTMEDLIVATFRRLSVRELDRLAQALSSSRPLREIWQVCMHTSDARLVSEFMALANRIDELQTEVIQFIQNSRRLQVEALTAALERRSRKSSIEPGGLALLATSVALALTRESELGIQTGHKDIMTAIETFLAQVEPAAPSAKAAQRRATGVRPRATRK